MPNLFDQSFLKTDASAIISAFGVTREYGAIPDPDGGTEAVRLNWSQVRSPYGAYFDIAGVALSQSTDYVIVMKARHVSGTQTVLDIRADADVFGAQFVNVADDLNAGSPTGNITQVGVGDWTDGVQIVIPFNSGTNTELTLSGIDGVDAVPYEIDLYDWGLYTQAEWDDLQTTVPSGTITDAATGLAVEGAKVNLFSKASTLAEPTYVEQVNTNANGVWEMTANYASNVGYEAQVSYHKSTNTNGTATSGSNVALTDSNANWTADEFAPTPLRYLVKITSGTSSGDERVITTNDTNTITVGTDFTSNIDNTSAYEVVEYMVGVTSYYEPQE